jgi:ribosomal protein S18 acetylase RimI-like enzyme
VRVNVLPPAYGNLPVTLLGRLAVDKNFAKQGLGEFLLIDGLKKSFQRSTTAVGSMAVVVDPLDQDAVNFYRKYQFINLADSGRMFLPIRTIRSLF